MTTQVKPTNLDRTYVISDIHLGHQNILKHDKRPFPTIKEHDVAITEGILETVPERGTLWLLGDVGRAPQDTISLLVNLAKKKLTVNLVRGNHDDDIADSGLVGKYKFTRFHSVRDVAYIRLEGEKFFMSHYPHISWRGSHRGSYHMHGHVHGALGAVADKVRRMDVGANVLNYKPISFRQVIETLKSKTFNNHHEP